MNRHEKQQDPMPPVPEVCKDRQQLLSEYQRRWGVLNLEIQYQLQQGASFSEPLSLGEPNQAAVASNRHRDLELPGRIKAQLHWSGPELADELLRELLWCILEQHTPEPVVESSWHFAVTDVLEWLDRLSSLNVDDMEQEDLLRGLLANIRHLVQARYASLALTRKDGQAYHWLHDPQSASLLLDSLDQRPSQDAWSWTCPDLDPPLHVMLCHLNIGQGPWLHCLLARPLSHPFDRGELSMVTYLGRLYAHQLNYRQVKEDLHLSAQLMRFEREEQLRRQQKISSLKIHIQDLQNDMEYLVDTLNEWRSVADAQSHQGSFNMELASLEEELNGIRQQLSDKLQAMNLQVLQIVPK